MQIALLLAVLAAVACSQESYSGPAPQCGVRIILIGCVAALVPLTAVAMSLRAARGMQRDARYNASSSRWFRTLRRAHCVLYLAGAGAIIFWLRWPQVVRFNLGLDGWLLIDELLILAPVAAPALLSLAAFGYATSAMRNAHESPVDRGSKQTHTTAIAEIAARHYAALFAAPILLVLVASDAAEWSAASSSNAAPQWPILIAILGLLIVLQPLLLRLIWKTERLPDGQRREQLLATARGAGMNVRDMVVWRTGGRIANAAIAGAVPGRRYLFLSDALLEKLNAEEVEMVVLHEAAHVRRRHIPLRLLVLLLPLWWWLMTSAALDDLGIGASDMLLPLGPSSASTTLLVAGALIAYAFVALGACARVLEHDADLWACGFDRRNPADAQERVRRCAALTSALNKLAAFSGERNRAQWLHPSIDRRVALLAAAVADRRLAVRRLDGVEVLSAGIYLAALAAPLLLLL